MKIDPDDPNVRLGVFGKQVEDFLETDVGRYIVRKANDKAEKAIDALKRISPNDNVGIQILQNEIGLAESIVEWLADAIITGQQAIDHLRSEE